jgi:hypothetical protein
MYKVYPRTTYEVMNEKNYQRAAIEIPDELTAQKMAQALNEQEEKASKELEKVKAELSELRSVLPT